MIVYGVRSTPYGDGVWHQVMGLGLPSVLWTGQVVNEATWVLSSTV